MPKTGETRFFILICNNPKKCEASRRFHISQLPLIFIFYEDINIHFIENLLCVERLSKKEGVVITTLARYLLGEKCGNRLKTIDELATECRSSVGLTQAALKNAGIKRSDTDRTPWA